jgi:hypothetical protein
LLFRAIISVRQRSFYFRSRTDQDGFN